MHNHKQQYHHCGFFCVAAILFLLCGKAALAHPMPNSFIQLDIHERSISADIQVPLDELGLALKGKIQENIAELPTKQVLERHYSEIASYLLQHSTARTRAGLPWSVEIEVMRLDSSSNPINGQFYELFVRMVMKPPEGSPVQDFVWFYDAVLHQVVTHSALVAVRYDWGAGIIDESAQRNSREVGVIAWDIRSNTLSPFILPPIERSIWQGFAGMFVLGMEHIRLGIDHLLFLIVLLLPAPLMQNGKQWGRFGGVRYAALRLLRIITAFTLGHSLTLLVGALKIVSIDSRVVELCIAASIAVSALHALRPMFVQREMWIAAGFGLVHGLAFAETLQHLELGAIQLALSIAGFNIGIEWMQLCIVVSIVPFLLLLSKGRLYAGVRIIVAVSAMIAAFAWGIERWSGQENLITPFIEQCTRNIASVGLMWGIFAVVSVLMWYGERRLLPKLRA